MKHFDEHTLELLILGDPSARRRERQIKGHLDGCVGCRDMFETIKKYYEGVEKERTEAASPVPALSQRSLIRKRNDLEPYFALPDGEVVSYTEVRIPTLWRRLGAFRREHPVLSSFSALMILALVASLLTFVWTRKGQPSYYFYNTKANELEIYSSSNKLLWALPTFDIEGEKKYENAQGAHGTVITDLDGDGKEDIITTVPLRSDGNSRLLRVYGANGNLKKIVSFNNKEISFRGEDYYAPFEPLFLMSARMPDGSANLFVCADNGRSPALLARFDANLNLVGEYWHYGDFTPKYVGPLRNGGAEIVITGIDDRDEISGGKFAFVAVLDPTKIVGVKESEETPGFGFDPSDAELYYIKLPESSLEKAEAMGSTPRMLNEGADSIVQIQVESGSDNTVEGFWGLDFIFSTNDMAVREVKYVEPTPLTFDMLRKRGKVRGRFDREYLENLKNGVRYWNGEAWVKTPTRIVHAEVAAN